VSEKYCTFFKNISLGPRCFIRIFYIPKRRVFQSKLGVSSNIRCNLHHSPHTGHLEKKKGVVQSFSDTLYFKHYGFGCVCVCVLALLIHHANCIFSGPYCDFISGPSAVPHFSPHYFISGTIFGRTFVDIKCLLLISSATFM